MYTAHVLYGQIRQSLYHLKLPFLFQKLIKKNTQMYTLYTNLLSYIPFAMVHYIGQGQFYK